MYTKFDFNFHLSRETPSIVVETIEAMLSTDSFDKPILEDKPNRWRYMFSQTSNVEFYKGVIQVRVRGEIKNYESEIEAFLNMVKPWIIERGKVVGTSHYEEWMNPHLVVIGAKGHIHFVKDPEEEGGLDGWR